MSIINEDLNDNATVVFVHCYTGFFVDILFILLLVVIASRLRRDTSVLCVRAQKKKKDLLIQPNRTILDVCHCVGVYYSINDALIHFFSPRNITTTIHIWTIHISRHTHTTLDKPLFFEGARYNSTT